MCLSNGILIGHKNLFMNYLVMRNIFNKLSFLYFLLFTGGLIFVNSGKVNAQDIKHLRVGVAGHAPFITNDTTQETGISLEIWSSIAAEKNWGYDTIRYPNVQEALKALEEGHLDLVVGPVSITSDRLKKVDFSQPYYYSGLSIMSRLDPPTIWDRIKPLFSTKLLAAVLIFLGILAIVGTLIWLAERKRSPEQFPEDISHGVANGMWLAIVTMTTTGYGDRAPITFWGRVICGSWMIISIIFATTMVAGIASTLTLSGLGTDTITEANQLKGKKVATPSESVTNDFLYEFRAKPVGATTLEEAITMLEDGKVDAVVFDRPQLLYYKHTHPTLDVVVGRAEYDPNGYGFAFPLRSPYPLVKEVNIEMMKLNEVGNVKKIVKSWVGNEDML